MSRSIEEINIVGRNYDEVRNEVIQWMNDNKVKLVEENPGYIKGRIGLPGGLGFTAPKYFEITMRADQRAILVHIEGFIGVYGVSESSFSANAVLGALPRRQGWKIMGNLLARLKPFSKEM